MCLAMSISKKLLILLSVMSLATAITLTPERAVSGDIIELGDVNLSHQHYFTNSTDNMPAGSTARTGYDLGINFILLDCHPPSYTIYQHRSSSSSTIPSQ